MTKTTSSLDRMADEPIILSDEEDDYYYYYSERLSSSKKRRTRTDLNPNPKPTLLILDDDDDDDPTPPPKSTTRFVADVEIVECTGAASTSYSDPKLSASGINGVICLESDDNESESEDKENRSIGSGFGAVIGLDWSSRSFDSTSYSRRDDSAHMSEDSSSESLCLQDDVDKVTGNFEKDNEMVQIGNINRQKRKNKVTTDKEIDTEPRVRTRMSEEEKTQLLEAKKLKKLEDKLQREALKAKTTEMKKLQKIKQKWEKGKSALKSVVAEIDSKVVEMGSVGGILLTQFAERGITYRITSNPIERSIVWTMTVPEQFSQLSPGGTEIKYILLVYEAHEFCQLIKESLFRHVLRIQRCYPSYTICYLTNRLLAYISKRDQELFKNPTVHNDWTRPPVEKMLAELTTNFDRVHSRQCKDETELAEHVIGLTCSLSSCQFRKKLSRLDVNANGTLTTKDCVDRNLIGKSTWLKALVAIPKVQPRFALAIGKKYPTMRSLLSVYMNPNISVHDKECLLKDLMTEGLLGGDRRVGEVCSKRVYRILMAQSGSIRTEDVEDGADFFRQQSA